MFPMFHFQWVMLFIYRDLSLSVVDSRSLASSKKSASKAAATNEIQPYFL
jgi:hypothetical protein